MLAMDIKRKIIEILKKGSNEFNTFQVKSIVALVYGPEKVNDRNILLLEGEVYSILCKLEKEGKVKNDNPLPVQSPQTSPKAMAASRWYYVKNK